ncbi:hypothetical protein O181_105183 [Austropuccinia psidii MF-1]|uniref:Uncharacterized protein n=1 Tax=Austropuccinia psidii MF-1 TaxID=1389203 RepID=A0A9Q3JNI9_9BASI|nr:hypothetical protein [Austropuccinia psidii MF-1]
MNLTLFLTLKDLIHHPQEGLHIKQAQKYREAMELHIKELLDLGVIRKVVHNEEVEITTPVIVASHIGKYRMVGYFTDLNTYTVPDRYPIPKIQISFTQIYQAVYMSTMDSLKGFHQNW